MVVAAVLPLLVIGVPLFFAIVGVSTPMPEVAPTGAVIYTPSQVSLLAQETGIPEDALDAYLSAYYAYRVPWYVLAGIGKQECNHGRSGLAGCHPRGTINSSGARGPMQFLGNTWRASAGQYDLDVAGDAVPAGSEHLGYATDADGVGGADPWSWLDATHAAARLLVHNGWEDDPRQAIWSYNHVWDYVDAVAANAAAYRAVEARLQREGRLPTGGLALAGATCPVEPRGTTEPLGPDPQITPATQALRDVVVACFGRLHPVYCHSPRDGTWEHPRGRACDFMATDGGMGGPESRAWGLALATWVMEHAEELHVLYVIWADRVWFASEGPVPWGQWRDYSKCENPCTDPSVGHYNHVHVSVHLRPGDPSWAACPHSACSE